MLATKDRMQDAGGLAPLAAAIVLLVASCSSSAGNATTSTENQDSRTSTSGVAVTAAPTSAGASITAPPMSSEVSAVSTSTTLGSVADLVGLLPVAADLPTGWAFEDGEPRVTFEPATGFYRGVCSGGNADGRAQESGSWGVAKSAEYRTPQGAWGYASVYGFGDETAAQRFLDNTRAAGNCAQTGDVAEGSAAGEYDGFSDPALDGTLRWSVAESTQALSESVPESDSAVAVITDDGVTTTSSGVSYSAQLREVTVFARFGSTVLVVSLGSYCCDQGFAQAASQYSVSLEDLRPAIARFARRLVEAQDRGRS